jgi:hypothetical protein
MGFARQLKWLGEVLPLKVAKFMSCIDSLDFIPILKNAVLSSIGTPDCSKQIAKCPFCNYMFSRKWLWKHLYYTHYEELLKVVDKYIAIKSGGRQVHTNPADPGNKALKELWQAALTLTILAGLASLCI